MNWLEVSLTVDGELAEAVAEVLARFAYSGVMMEQSVQYMDAEDAGTPAGPITVRAYLEGNRQLEEKRQKLEESLHYLGMILPLPVPVYREIADQNWMEAWKQHYRPIPVGKGLLILPAWQDSAGGDRIPIKIDPGMAFGTGTHPTTQLCLELIEHWFSQPEGANRKSNIIDVGCGSGILSIAALKLGASRALGVDTDARSLENARENAQTNGIGKELILGAGSVQEILDGKFSIRQAPLVVANILAPVIIRLLDAGLAELIEAGGEIVLSGILQEQSQSVITAGQGRGLKLHGQRQRADWVALLMGR